MPNKEESVLNKCASSRRSIYLSDAKICNKTSGRNSLLPRRMEWSAAASSSFLIKSIGDGGWACFVISRLIMSVAATAAGRTASPSTRTAYRPVCGTVSPRRRKTASHRVARVIASSPASGVIGFDWVGKSWYPRIHLHMPGNSEDILHLPESITGRYRLHPVSRILPGNAFGAFENRRKTKSPR